MKKTLVATLVLAMCLALTACSQKNPVTGYKSGDVTLGQYKGVTYTGEVIYVDDDMVMERIDSDLLSTLMVNKPVTDRTTVEDGDTIILDYVGYTDYEAGVVFDGGSAYGAELTIGSASMIPGFEEAIIGREIDTPFTFEVTFPTDYFSEEMAGKLVTFEASVHEINVKALPELTDELVTNNTVYLTVDDYKEAVYNELVAEQESAAKASLEYQVFKKIFASSTFNVDLTEQIASDAAALLRQESETYANYFGSGIDAYYLYNLYYGMDEAMVDEYFQARAKMNLQYGYVLSAVAEAENITATDAEIDEMAAQMTSSYGYSTTRELYDALASSKNVNGRKFVEGQVILNKAAEVIVTSAIDGE